MKVRFSSVISPLIIAFAPLVAFAEPRPDSVSCGSVNRGGLGNPIGLARTGPGYEIPAMWWQRGNRFATSELVGLIRRAAARVARDHPGAVLGVGDLSRARGGAIKHHRSHQSGRDADLIFYALDARKRPMRPGNFLPRYRGDRRATHASSPEWMKLPRQRWFDAARNWALVVALVQDKTAEIERIFVSLRIYRWLLDAGRGAGAPADVIAAVTDVLRVARGRQDHGDHFHVRIRCSAQDIRVGLCRPYLAPPPPDRTKWRWGIRCPR